MTTTIFIILGVIIIAVAILIIKKKKVTTPQIPIGKDSEYVVPQKSGQITFTEYSENIEELPKEVAKNVSKWSDFEFLYLSDGLAYKNNIFSELANGVYVVENSQNRLYYDWSIIKSGVIVEQGTITKPR